ncbi:hypothetical protein CSA17_06540 [bacterium DOLJORAL78_65_58]|nr:MAG: hypothetical protein CSA17_06540 [bacterium DOLJORAL78_65_58]
MIKKQKRREFQVGILATLAILLLVVGMLWFRNVDLSDEKTRYQVDFQRVEGLREGDKVQIRGIRMGEVESLTLLPTAVRVQIKMSEKAVLTDEAVVVLGERGIVGEIVLEIDPGRGRPVQEGHVFQGRTAGTIAAMTDAAGDALAEMRIMVEKVNELVAEVREQGKVVQTLAQANKTFTRVDEMLERNDHDIRISLENLVVATQGLRRFVESGQVTDAFDGMDRTLAGADSLMNNLNIASERLNVVLGKMISNRPTWPRRTHE